MSPHLAVRKQAPTEIGPLAVITKRRFGLPRPQNSPRPDEQKSLPLRGSSSKQPQVRGVIRQLSPERRDGGGKDAIPFDKIADFYSKNM